MLVFNGDLPTPDDPLPKFLSDPDAAKLMRAAADAHPTRRFVVEILVRTGLRVSEFCELPLDSVIVMNDRHWLRGRSTTRRRHRRPVWGFLPSESSQSNVPSKCDGDPPAWT